MTQLVTGIWDSFWSLTEPWLADRDMPDQFRKVAIVTGGTSGIGFEVVRKLAAFEAHVIIGARNPDNAESCIKKLKQEMPWAKVEWLPLDLCSFASVAAFVDAFKAKSLPLHALINNAGELFPPPGVTEDGFDHTLEVDYYGPAFLTLLLLDTLKATAPARIVNMSSQGYLYGSIDWRDPRGVNFSNDNWGRGLRAYGMAKLMMVMWTKELQWRLKGSGVDVFAVHPGLCATSYPSKVDTSSYWPAPQILIGMTKVLAQRPHYGAQSTLYAATEPKLQGRGGQFIGPTHALLNFVNTSHNWILNPQAWTEGPRRRLYQMTLEILDEATWKIKPKPFAPKSLTPGQDGTTKFADKAK